MKTILIDLWGTLLANPELNPVEQIISDLNLKIKHHELIQLCDKEGLFSKTISSSTIWESILSKLNKSPEEAQLANNIWLNSSRNIHLFPKTKEFLLQLKEKGHTLVLASAIDKDSYNLLEEKFSFKKYFDHIKPTYSMGVGKSEDYYQRICSELKIEPINTTMIGDSVEFDIIPSTKAGLHSIFLNRFIINEYEKTHLPKNALVCSSFEEVIMAINNL